MNAKTRFVSIKTFKEIAADKAVEQENIAIRKSFIITKLDEINGTDEKPTLKFSITTQDVDRDNDTVALGGWDFSDFAKNPVVLWAHNYSTPPVAKAINIFRDVASIDSTAEFTPKNISEFGFMIYQMYKGGFLSAVSVGFQPSDFEAAKDRDGGINFTRQSLMEYSAVPVPSNPNALIQARSIGINTMPMKAWAENILDDWEKSGEGVLMPKTEIELIRSTSDEKSAVSVPVKNDTSEQESTEAENEKPNISDDNGEESKDDQETETTESSDSQEESGDKSGDKTEDNQETEDEKSWLETVNEMAALLGDPQVPANEETRKAVHEVLSGHYEKHGKTAPEYRFVQAQVLKNMPDDYYFDEETGQIEKLTDEIKIERESKTVMDILKNCMENAKTEHVQNAAAEALNAFKDYKDLDCCSEHEHNHKSSDNQEKDTADVFLELEVETDGIEKDAIFDESVTLEAIAEIVEAKVNETMRKRSGRLD